MAEIIYRYIELVVTNIGSVLVLMGALGLTAYNNIQKSDQIENQDTVIKIYSTVAGECQ